jgi:hypothetical protein
VAVTRSRKTVGVTAPISVKGCGFIRQYGAEQSRFVDEMAGNRSVEFVRRNENPPPLYRSAGDPARTAPAQVRHPDPAARSAHVPVRGVPAPDPIERMAQDLSGPSQISEEEFFAQGGPGWSEEDLNRMPDMPAEENWEPIQF